MTLRICLLIGLLAAALGLAGCGRQGDLARPQPMWGSPAPLPDPVEEPEEDPDAPPAIDSPD